jgi:hypothetical protein
MKKLLAVFVTAALFLAPLNAVAAVKAGAACSKLGATSTSAGKKYTCIKSGKKLVWNKGVTVVKTLPTKNSGYPKELDKCAQGSPWTIGYDKNNILLYLSCAPDGLWHPQNNAPEIDQTTGKPKESSPPNSSPPSTNSNQTYPAKMDPIFAAMWEKAMREVSKANYPGKAPEVFDFTEPGYPLNHRNATVDGIKETLARFGAWNTEQKSYYLIFALTQEFADAKFQEVKKLLNSNRPVSDFHGPYWTKMWDMNDPHYKMKLNWSTNTTVDGHSVQMFQGYAGQDLNIGTKAGAIHEAWHPLIDMYAKPGIAPNACWWTEGTATFLSTTLASKTNTVNSYLDAGLMVSASGIITSSKSIEGSHPMRMTDWTKESCDSIGGYWEGAVVAATLIAEYGWEKFLQFARVPVGVNWWIHFKDIYGIEVEDFYTKSDPYLLQYRKYLDNR